MAGKQRQKVETVDLFITMTDTSDSSKSQGGSGTTTKVKFAWKGNKLAYPDEVAKELGVAVAKDNEPGLIYGMNKPRPARVYINVKGAGSGGTGAGGKKKSNNKAYLLFADPKKLPALLIKNSLRGKKYRGGTITSVSLPKTSTNPNRKKKTTSKTPLKKK
ncbi:hypothetical protein FACHB389_35925 [Nostoc calcicola FACHB-389]|nr:hypothetical protein [Nostoc calcicola FACHB-3891]OKH14610.1 hypothetical protein FACHB389_35925 [Nostoc calcicola FACHB-389]